MKSTHTLPHQPQDLADEIRLLREQLRKIKAEASHNETVLSQFYERELTLLSAEDLPQLLSLLTKGMKQSFDLSEITLALHDPSHELRHLLHHSNITPESYQDIWFLDRLGDLNPILETLTKPLLGPYLGADHASLFPDKTGLRSISLLPLTIRDRRVGSLNLGSRSSHRFTRHHASDFLLRLATISAICLENTINREHLVISGLTDALTGLHNRRYLEKRLTEEITRARRYSYPLSCLFVDADHFKQVNDHFGHNTGDAVLREIALRLKACLRASDIATRFGGEEFALLLPQTDAREAVVLAQRITRAVAEKPISTATGECLSVTVSIGVSELAGATDRDNPAEQLLWQADKALYRSKMLGRNRVERYAPNCPIMQRTETD